MIDVQDDDVQDDENQDDEVQEEKFVTITKKKKIIN